MAFTRVVLAWLAAAVWLVGWELVARRLRQEAAARAVAPVPLPLLAGEALWLALFAALWIASIGAGAFWLVLLLVGLASAWTPVLSAPLPLTPQKRAVALATRVGRVLGAGLLASVPL